MLDAGLGIMGTGGGGSIYGCDTQNHTLSFVLSPFSLLKGKLPIEASVARELYLV